MKINSKSSNNYIVVNATAIEGGGALSILKQFIENIPLDDNKWLIFISDKIHLDKFNENVRIEKISGVKSLFKRFWWDLIGLRKWLRNNKIIPIAKVSLQNTGFLVGKDIPSFIYFHQSIPFYNKKWNPLIKEQRTLWFYKNVYPIFVKMFLKKETIIFVQLDYIKKGFSNYFKHPLKNIVVVHPVIKINKTDNFPLKKEGIDLFYPTSNFFYKNIVVLIEALSNTSNNIKLYLTLKDDCNNDKIEYMGPLTFNEVCGMYESCDALVFPSYIETYGLPLIEAATRGVPILAADLPYAREVLSGYEGVKFIPFNNADAWRCEMEKLEKSKRYKPFDVSNRPSWKELFEKINKNIF
ncbi:MAG: glycosyltransferase [Muribaculaceae bacterium]|nr:glycosyltransferase [Muribaculaceae bacterium]